MSYIEAFPRYTFSSCKGPKGVSLAARRYPRVGAEAEAKWKRTGGGSKYMLLRLVWGWSSLYMLLFWIFPGL